jgi:hypothetical protein
MLHDGPPRIVERLAHTLVDGAHIGVMPDPGSAAPVILEIVDAPVRPSLGIDVFVAVAANEPTAGLGTRGRTAPVFREGLILPRPAGKGAGVARPMSPKRKLRAAPRLIERCHLAIFRIMNYPTKMLKAPAHCN